MKNYEELLAITEVKYVVDQMNSMDRVKIPAEIYEILQRKYVKEYYEILNIDAENIDNISDLAKELLDKIMTFIVDD